MLPLCPGAFELGPKEAHAATYRIRSITIGRATQYARTDTTLAAPRRFTQGLGLSAFDLAGDRSGSLNLHLQLRYFNDFGLEQRLQQHPGFEHQWNSALLDIGYLQWRPISALDLRLGRQWAMGSLGVRDFDGFLVRWSPAASDSLRPYIEVHAGRDVHLGLTRWDPGTWDVQGLPPNEALAADTVHWLVGGHAGLRVSDRASERASIDVSYLRRFRRSDSADRGPGGAASDGETRDEAWTMPGTIVGDERLGLAVSGSPHRNVILSANASYHMLLQDLDRAGVHAGWRIPGWESMISAGIDQRRPIFDSSSIFNLFGAQPHRSLFAVYQHPIESLATQLELRTWSRLYYGDLGATDAGSGGSGGSGGPGIWGTGSDAQAWGAALAHHSRVRLWDRGLQWSSQISAQTGTGDAYAGDQLLGDTRLRLPVGWQRIHVSGRALALWSRPENWRHTEGYATTFLLGLDMPVSDVGLLSLALDTSQGSFFPPSTSAFATFELEVWR